MGFFVLEHIDEPNEIIKALASKPPNTVLVFSVPTYGFSTILEAVFTEHAARNLDSVVHRQLYTDNSIDKFLELCGYDLADKWVFGQDALDFKRLLIKGMESIYDTEFADGISRKLTDLIDPLQGVIDTNLLSDARHIIAIKR